jgi:purine-nucleoside phosphorylase
MVDVEAFTFDELPGFPPPSVPGHAGKLLVGLLDGVPVAAFQGRIHYYEGNELSRCALPVRLARVLGARTLVLTAATGGIDRDLVPGSIVVGTDQINLMGANPLRGWRNPDGSPPFVALSEVFDRELAELAVERASAMGLELGRGVYVAMPGPSFETPAEIAMIRRSGGSVVGMSVVPESVVARALDMRVLGLFSVTNMAGDQSTHQDVLAMADRAAVSMNGLLRGLLPLLGDGGSSSADPTTPRGAVDGR